LIYVKFYVVKTPKIKFRLFGVYLIIQMTQQN